jgi:hypothetical protein
LVGLVFKWVEMVYSLVELVGLVFSRVEMVLSLVELVGLVFNWVGMVYSLVELVQWLVWYSAWLSWLASCNELNNNYWCGQVFD